MMRRTNLFKLLTAALVLCASASAQEPAAGDGRFEKDGLSFSYPAGWTVTDRSTEQAQDLSLSTPGSLAVVRIVAHREVIESSERLSQLRQESMTPLIEAQAGRLGLAKSPTWNEVVCARVGKNFATGFRMTGRLNGKPATTEVYSVTLGQRLVLLVYVRADGDEAAGAPAWKSVLDTLRVEPPANPSPEVEKFARVVTGGVLNGRVLKKPAPEYPAMALAERAQGVVVVRLVVDESGQVESAQGVSGHPRLRAAAVDAARKAKFSPTLLCGRPVKVSGIITYNFVLQ